MQNIQLKNFPNIYENFPCYMVILPVIYGDLPIKSSLQQKLTP